MSTSPKPFAFVVMPFDNKFDDIYKLGIFEAAKLAGFYAERVDEQIFVENITDRIYNQISKADIIIADMTGRNANVFYEVGYAHGLNKMVLLLTQTKDDIPFDLVSLPHIIYKDSIATLKTELQKKLEWALIELETKKPSSIQIKMAEQTATLDKNEYRAKASINFRIDMINNTIKKSPEIYAIYFYTGIDWSITQEGTRIDKTSSDIEDYKHKYYLRPTTRILPPNNWVPLKFTTERTIATVIKDELKDSYLIQGKALIRLATDEGNIDFTLGISVTANELPF
jgi:hypothetical protein